MKKTTFLTLNQLQKKKQKTPTSVSDVSMKRNIAEIMERKNKKQTMRELICTQGVFPGLQEKNSGKRGELR
jgi:peroxiredoxin family protein